MPEKKSFTIQSLKGPRVRVIPTLCHNYVFLYFQLLILCQNVVIYDPVGTYFSLFSPPRLLLLVFSVSLKRFGNLPQKSPNMLYSEVLSCPLQENNTTSDCDDCIVRARHRLLQSETKTRDPRPHSKCNMPCCVAVYPITEGKMVTVFNNTRGSNKVKSGCCLFLDLFWP